MRRLCRSTRVLVPAAAVAGTAAVTTGTAAAAPPPGLALIGTQLTIAPAGACHGNIIVGLDQVPHDGRLTVTLAPTGTWGTAGCPADVEVSAMSGNGPQTRLVRVDSGQAHTTIDVGFGFAMINVDSIEPAVWNAGYHILMLP